MQVGGISRPKAAAAAEQRRHFLGVAEVATLDVAFKAACHDGERVYGADRQGTMRTLSCADGTVKGFSKCTAVPHCIACVGGREVWVGCADGDLHVFSADTAEVIKRWRAHNGGVTCIGVGVDAVYTGGADFKLRKWSYQGEQLAARGHHHGLVQGMLVLDPPPAVTAKREPTLVWTGGADKVVGVWEDAEGAALSQVNEDLESSDQPGCVTLPGHTKVVGPLCAVGSGQVWTGGEEGEVRVWGRNTRRAISSFSAHRGAVATLTVMGRLVFSSGDGKVNCWSAASRELLHSLEIKGYVRCALRIGWGVWVFAKDKVHIWATESVTDGLQDELREALEREMRNAKRAQQLEADLGAAERDKQAIKKSTDESSEAWAKQLKEMEARKEQEAKDSSEDAAKKQKALEEEKE